MKMKTRVHPKDFDAVRALINDIQALESRSHRLMMIDTAHVLNKAKNTAGWELEGQMDIHLKSNKL
jgi:hypothetical protein